MLSDVLCFFGLSMVFLVFLPGLLDACCLCNLSFAEWLMGFLCAVVVVRGNFFWWWGGD